MQDRIRHHLKLCSDVVLYALIQEKCHELERGLIVDLRSDESGLCEKIYKQIDMFQLRKSI